MREPLRECYLAIDTQILIDRCGGEEKASVVASAVLVYPSTA